MDFGDTIKNSVQNNIITPLRKSAEGIFRDEINKGINTVIGNSPFASFLPRGSTGILEFPLDVASGDAALGNHGHYIMFYINEQDKAQLTMSDKGSGGSGSLNEKISLKAYDVHRLLFSGSGDEQNINTSTKTFKIQTQKNGL